MFNLKTHILILCSLFILSGFIFPPEIKRISINPSNKVDFRLYFPFIGKKFPKCKDSSLLARIVINNNSDTLVSFYEDWNLWGYYNISFEIRTTCGTYTIQKIEKMAWDKNYPSYKTIFPGDSLILN